MAPEIDRANPLFGRAVPVRFTGVEGAEEIRQLTVNVLSGSKVRACAAFRPFFALPNPTTRHHARLNAFLLTHTPPRTFLSPTQSVTSPLRAAQQQRTLRLELTDERDPFFLFFLDVGEDEFPELKREQSLRVDFDNFAQMFVELLTRVLDGGAAPAASSSSDDDDADAASAEVDFYAVLRTAEAEATSSLADAHFEVVQANDFKNLMHLSLRMRAADDVATARNLAARLALQRERNAELRNEAQQKDAALAVLQEERASAVEELEVLQRQQGNSQRALRLEHGEEINGLRRTADEDREAMRVQHSEESRAAAAASEAKLEAERARSAELQDRHDEFAATSARIQTELRQESARAAATEAEMERLHAENSTLRRENERSQSELHKKTKALNALQITQSALAQKVEDAEEMADRLQSYERGLKEQLTSAKEAIHVHRESAKQREMENEAAIHEINKGNEIIDRLRARLSKLKGEAKLRNNIVQQQERRLEQETRALTLEQRRVRFLLRERERECGCAPPPWFFFARTFSASSRATALSPLSPPPTTSPLSSRLSWSRTKANTASSLCRTRRLAVTSAHRKLSSANRSRSSRTCTRK